MLALLPSCLLASFPLPLVHNNTRTITFDVRFYEPGEHKIAIGSTPYGIVNVSGEPLQFLYTDLNVSAKAIPVGEEIIVSATVENVGDYENSTDANFYVVYVSKPVLMDGKVIDSKSITPLPGKSKKVTFRTKPGKGIYKIGIGNTNPVTVEVYPHHPVDIAKCELHTHCSGTARPCEFNVDKVNNRYTIKAGGTDFLHAEDSYGAIYLKGIIKGNFVATLKVTEFGENVNPWYRAGIFVRNDIAKSHETEPGSLGSVLMYTTPKLSGIQWDEFGDGCMHVEAKRKNGKTVRGQDGKRAKRKRKRGKRERRQEGKRARGKEGNMIIAVLPFSHLAV